MAQQNPVPYDDPRIIDSSEAFLTKNLYPLIIAIIALLMLAVAATWWWSSKNSGEEQALQLYYQSKTANEWQKIIQSHPASPAAALALIDLAHQKVSTGDFTGAVSIYQDFLKKFGKHPAAASVELALAISLENSGKTAEAKDAYNKILSARPVHPFVGPASIGLARIYLQENNLLAARQTLTDYITANEENSGGSQAREMLNSLPPAAK